MERIQNSENKMNNTIGLVYVHISKGINVYQDKLTAISFNAIMIKNVRRLSFVLELWDFFVQEGKYGAALCISGIGVLSCVV